MRIKQPVLWLEDTATYDLQEMAAFVRTDGRFELVIADNATDGVAAVLQREFDAVVVDIRIPPGDDRRWIQLFEKHESNRIRARLGRHFLYSVLGHANAKVQLEAPPSWISPLKIGVMTVERQADLDDDLRALGIVSYRQKRADTPEDALARLVEDMLKQAPPIEGHGR
jgi:DNA-binding NarL/FixJ family response regulator